MVTAEPHLASAHPREAEVVKTFRNKGAVTRAQITDITGLSRSTVSAVIGRLVDEGVVVVASYDEQPGRGRPTERVEIDRTVVRSIGVDLAHGMVRAVGLSLLGDQLALSAREHDDTIDWDQRRAIVQEVVGALDLPATLPALRGIGLGISGPVPLPQFDVETWEPIVADLGRSFSVEVQVDNTTRYAAFAEHTAASNPADITLHLRCFQGVGGAVVRAEELDRGATGMAGELGHVQVDPEGAPCRCGKRGCLETIASTPAVLDECRNREPGIVTLADLHQALAEDRKRLGPLLDRVAQAIAHVLVIASTLIDPDEIILSGDLLDADDSLLAAVEHLYTRSMGERFRAASVRRSGLDGTAGVLGAALTFTHSHPRP
ncbi:ROK family transcriptional regulator [Arthrobacter castelli]|uniref:ROK family transcriptional regulator n=1 Tax=Arthrobacter castelli TaxID=271431 RepID=UPI00040289D6|nr:ROK family transcriptional regulator [Arthrobacter castelli]